MADDQAPVAPKPGDTQDGYVYNGGDPSRPESWTAIPESWGDYAKGIGRSAAQGAALGWGDEAIAKARELGGQGDYASNLDEERQALADFHAKHPYASTGAELAGGLVVPLPGAAAATGLREGITAGKIAKGALTVGAPVGATYALGSAENLSPEQPDFAERTAKTAGEGALRGAAGYAVAAPVGEMASRMVAPQSALERGAIRTLENENVRLTPGMKAGGAVRWAEDNASSIPFVGQIIRRAQRDAVEDVNTAQLNRGLRGAITEDMPHGEVLPASMAGGGNEAVAHVSDKLSGAYQEILPKLKGELDIPTLDAIDRVKAAVADMPGNVDGALSKRLDKIIEVNFMRRASRDPATLGRMDGEGLKASERELNRITTSYLKDSNGDLRDLGMQVGVLHDTLREMIMRHNPAEAPLLRRINEGYAHYVISRKAAGSTAAEGGQFNVTQLHHAVKSADRSLDHGDFARGRALDQDLSSAAKQVLPQRTPNSGTAERSMLGNLLTGALVLNPVGLAGAGALAAAYSRPGQAVIRAGMNMVPNLGSQTVADALNRGAARAAGGYAAGHATRSIIDALTQGRQQNQ